MILSQNEKRRVAFKIISGAGFAIQWRKGYLREYQGSVYLLSRCRRLSTPGRIPDGLPKHGMIIQTYLGPNCVSLFSSLTGFGAEIDRYTIRVVFGTPVSLVWDRPAPTEVEVVKQRN